MLCYIFPMKYMTSIFVAWITDRRVDVGANINSIEELFNIFVIYSIGFVALCLAVLLLNLRAWSKRAELRLDDIEEYTTRTEIGTWVILSSVGLLAILMGLFAPPHPLTVPGWAYSLLAILMPIWGFTRGRQIERMIEARGGAGPHRKNED